MFVYFSVSQASSTRYSTNSWPMPACAASLAHYKQNKDFFLSLLYRSSKIKFKFSYQGLNRDKWKLRTLLALESQPQRPQTHTWRRSLDERPRRRWGCCRGTASRGWRGRPGPRTTWSRCCEDSAGLLRCQAWSPQCCCCMESKFLQLPQHSDTDLWQIKFFFHLIKVSLRSILNLKI